jgi:hypothetical protein
MVPNHRRDARVPAHRGTMGAKPIAGMPVGIATAPLQQLQRHRGAQQSLGSLGRQIQLRRQRRRGPRTVRKPLEQIQLDAGIQGLRIDKAGTDVEQVARATLGDRPCQREVSRPALE